MEKTDYRVKQDWKAFDVPGATVIAQSSFWLANCTDDETFAMYINGTTIPRYRRIPRIRKRADLEQFGRTHLISNAAGTFRYHPNSRQKLRFGRAKDNTDWHFMRSLYTLFIQEVLPLVPREWSIRMVRGAGTHAAYRDALARKGRSVDAAGSVNSAAPDEGSFGADGRRIAARLQGRGGTLREHARPVGARRFG